MVDVGWAEDKVSKEDDVMAVASLVGKAKPR